MGCEHQNLYPDMNLQLKMARCGHFLMHGHWHCQDCGEWIFIECEDEWEGREGTKSKDRKYEYRRTNFSKRPGRPGENRIINIKAERALTGRAKE